MFIINKGVDNVKIAVFNFKLQKCLCLQATMSYTGMVSVRDKIYSDSV